jgi:CheY-like chemotaxis protein
MNLKKMLLVDDSSNDVELILKALEEHNLVNDVAVVRNGVEAMEYLLHQGKYQNLPAGNPIVILLDLKMPMMDGISTLRAIKQTEELQNIPVVILTSSREDSDLITCYELGANAYVVKPVQFSDFVDAVQRLGVFWALVNMPPYSSITKP